MGIRRYSDKLKGIFLLKFLRVSFLKEMKARDKKKVWVSYISGVISKNHHTFYTLDLSTQVIMRKTGIIPDAHLFLWITTLFRRSSKAWKAVL